MVWKLVTAILEAGELMSSESLIEISCRLNTTRLVTTALDLSSSNVSKFFNDWSAGDLSACIPNTGYIVIRLHVFIRTIELEKAY